MNEKKRAIRGAFFGMATVIGVFAFVFLMALLGAATHPLVPVLITALSVGAVVGACIALDGYDY
jgi:hypothetical protein